MKVVPGGRRFQSIFSKCPKEEHVRIYSYSLGWVVWSHVIYWNFSTYLKCGWLCDGFYWKLEHGNELTLLQNHWWTNHLNKSDFFFFFITLQTIDLLKCPRCWRFFGIELGYTDTSTSDHRCIHSSGVNNRWRANLMNLKVDKQISLVNVFLFILIVQITAAKKRPR